MKFKLTCFFHISNPPQLGQHEWSTYKRSRSQSFPQMQQSHRLSSGQLTVVKKQNQMDIETCNTEYGSPKLRSQRWLMNFSAGHYVNFSNSYSPEVYQTSELTIFTLLLVSFYPRRSQTWSLFILVVCPRSRGSLREGESIVMRYSGRVR